MCDDHGHYTRPDPDETWRPSRRELGRSALALAAAAALAPTLTSRAAAAVVPFDPVVSGTSPLSMAMHVHASFSEQTGSMDAQLYQAARNGVDVVWWTEHDHRMSALGYRSQVHFTSLTNELTDGAAWHWTPRPVGALASSTGGIVSSPASPNDPVVGGSLHVAATGKSTATASYGYFADAHTAAWNYHGNITGQTWSIDVLPTTVGPSAYLELLITLSYHQASGGRPAGVYQLSYRFGGPGSPGSSTSSGVIGIVSLPYTAGQWGTATIVPGDDIAALWPDLQAADFASAGITLNAVSIGGPAEGYFDLLEFQRQNVSGNLPLALQQQLEAAYALEYPSVTQRQGLEVSRNLPHLNWFGGAVTLTDYTGAIGGDGSPGYESFLAGLVPTIHAAGGLVSYNHPFGYTDIATLPTANQDALVSQVAAHLLGNGLLGCDILEVGYTSRSGVDLAHHLALWDVLSRNAMFLTGNGVTDDHFGKNWPGLHNNWVTTVWAASSGEADLLAAMASGRAWSSSLGQFGGQLDLLADGSCPMGSVSVAGVTNRQLQVLATGVPVGGSLQVVSGQVDYTGTSPTAAVTATVPASALTTGSVTLTVDTTVSRFFRTQLLTSGGKVVAVSNPIWLLCETPPNGIPTARLS